MQELSDYQKAHKLDRMLSPLEWSSYLFSAGNLLAGVSTLVTDPVLNQNGLKRVLSAMSSLTCCSFACSIVDMWAACSSAPCAQAMLA